MATFEKRSIHQKAYRQANLEKRKIQRRLHDQANPEKVRVYSRKRRALKLGNGHEPYTDSYIFERDGWICQLCGKRIDRKLKNPHPFSASIDHIIPLIKGGADAPLNLQSAHIRCNISKNDRGGGQLRLLG